DRVLVVMKPVDRPTLRARVPLRERMLLVTLHLDDLITDDLGDQPAVRHAHLAICALRLDGLTRHKTSPPRRRPERSRSGSSRSPNRAAQRSSAGHCLAQRAVAIS